ncbi:MATE family efflux transporter, partial [Akkermansia sp.]
MTKTLTSGNPAKLIFLFTIPLLIGNLFQQFYNMADTLIVGRTLGVEALAAVGCTGGLMFFILGFVIGFTAGLAIITAQRFGAGRKRAVRRSFAVCILLSAAA